MCSKKDSDKDRKKGERMTSATVQPSNISFSDFIKQNSKKIHAITPVNPTISKDDEWRDEDFWDTLHEEKGDSNKK